ncbi:MAG TPA: hypothetical protein VGR78_01725 [Verrucomicrobiae bacterium]|jgi:hypothetical protein|nr:hypothetical protein [Verrucomicrobiae bacterium]
MSPTLTSGVSLRRVAEIVRNAILFGPDAWEGSLVLRERSSSTQNLLPTDADVVELFTLLAARRIAYLLVGGIAMLRYVEGRNTEDINFLMSAPSLERIPEIVLEGKNEYFARGRFRSLRVDILLTANALFAETQQSFGTTHRFAEVEVPTATPEGLVLLKLYALPSLYRQGLLGRVAIYESNITGLIGLHHIPVAPLLARLGRHILPSDLREPQNIVNEIASKIARVEKLKGI